MLRPRVQIAGWGVLWLLSACGPSPEALTRRVAERVDARAFESVLRDVDPEYADPLGNRDTLSAALVDLDKTFARWSIRWAPTETRSSALTASVRVRVDAEMVGRIVWKVRGSMLLSLRRTDRWRIVSGLLTDFRDIRGLMERRRAALEANDADAMKDVLHPQYRDGLVDRREAIERLRINLEDTPVRMRVTNYRLEVRTDLAHVDEYYALSVKGRLGPPAVAGLTLKKSAGRWRIASGLYPDD